MTTDAALEECFEGAPFRMTCSQGWRLSLLPWIISERPLRRVSARYWRVGCDMRVGSRGARFRGRRENWQGRGMLASINADLLAGDDGAKRLLLDRARVLQKSA